VTSKVLLGDGALAVIKVIGAVHRELADPVATGAAELALAERKLQFHPIPAWEWLLQEKTGPRTGWKSRIGFEIGRRLERLFDHDAFLSESRATRAPFTRVCGDIVLLPLGVSMPHRLVPA
jgi:hypothetical protein